MSENKKTETKPAAGAAKPAETKPADAAPQGSNNDDPNQLGSNLDQQAAASAPTQAELADQGKAGKPEAGVQSGATAPDSKMPSDDVTDPDDPDKAGTKTANKVKGMPGRVWIILEENEEIPPTGLFVGVNGDSFLLRTGEPIAVPQGVIDVLDNAIMSAPVTDPSTRKVIGHRDRMRYPYRRVSAPKE